MGCVRPAKIFELDRGESTYEATCDQGIDKVEIETGATAARDRDSFEPR